MRHNCRRLRVHATKNDINYRFTFHHPPRQLNYVWGTTYFLSSVLQGAIIYIAHAPSAYRERVYCRFMCFLLNQNLIFIFVLIKTPTSCIFGVVPNKPPWCRCSHKQSLLPIYRPGLAWLIVAQNRGDIWKMFKCESIQKIYIPNLCTTDKVFYAPCMLRVLHMFLLYSWLWCICLTEPPSHLRFDVLIYVHTRIYPKRKFSLRRSKNHLLTSNTRDKHTTLMFHVNDARSICFE